MRIIRFALAACVTVAVAVAGCGGEDGTSIFEGDASVGGPFNAGQGGGSFGDGGVVEAGGGLCVPKTCAQLGFDCGPQGDGCGGICSAGLSGGPVLRRRRPEQVRRRRGARRRLAASPKTCADLGAACGQQGDGCGQRHRLRRVHRARVLRRRRHQPVRPRRQRRRPTCVAQDVRAARRHVRPAGRRLRRRRSTAAPAPRPQYCGGNGAEPVRPGGADGGRRCVPKTCAAARRDLRHRRATAAAARSTAAPAPRPQSCGGNGANQCGLGGADGGSACVPKTCAQLGATCGPQGDGCGGTLACGTCTAPAFCGGGGAEPVRPAAAPTAARACVPKTCAQLGATCGPQGDGCGGTLDCGTCTAPAVLRRRRRRTSAASAAPTAARRASRRRARSSAPPAARRATAAAARSTAARCTAPASCGGGGTTSAVCGGVDGGRRARPRRARSSASTAARWATAAAASSPAAAPARRRHSAAAAAPSVCGVGTIPTDAGTYVTCDGGGVTTITGTVLAGTDSTRGFGSRIRSTTRSSTSRAARCSPSPPAPRATSARRPQSALVSAVTGVDGKFTLMNPPVGTNMPLVIQLGHWRRVVSVNVTACHGQRRSPPRRRTCRATARRGTSRSSRSPPATSTSLECVLRKMGIDDGEFTNPVLSGSVPTGAGRVHVYQAHPGNAGDGGAVIDDDDAARGRARRHADDARTATTWSSSPARADATTSRRRDQTERHQLRQRGRPRLRDALQLRVALQRRARSPAPRPGTSTQGSYRRPAHRASSTQTFPKGQALSRRGSQLVGASTTLGQIPVQRRAQRLRPASSRRRSAGCTRRRRTRRCPSTTRSTRRSARPPAKQCGRVLFSDFHVENAAGDERATFPDGVHRDGAADAAGEAPRVHALRPARACSSTDAPTCTPQTCAQLGVNCGPQGDGCGGTLQLRHLRLARRRAAAAARRASAAHRAARRKTCAQQGISCGPAGDGCGGTLNCGTCAAPQTLRRRRHARRVRQPHAARPRTCAQQGIQLRPGRRRLRRHRSSCGACPLAARPAAAAACPASAAARVRAPETCAQRRAVNCGPAGRRLRRHARLRHAAPRRRPAAAAARPASAATAVVHAADLRARRASHCGPAGDGCGGSSTAARAPRRRPAAAAARPASAAAGTLHAAHLRRSRTSTAARRATAAAARSTAARARRPRPAAAAARRASAAHADVHAARRARSRTSSCGPAGDGCGNLLHCGSCTPAQTVRRRRRARPVRPPDVHAARPARSRAPTCGPAGDGCGGRSTAARAPPRRPAAAAGRPACAAARARRADALHPVREAPSSETGAAPRRRKRHQRDA